MGSVAPSVTPAIDVRSRPSTHRLDICLPQGKSQQLLLSVSIVQLQPQNEVKPFRHRLKGVHVPPPRFRRLKGVLVPPPWRQRGILVPPPALPVPLRLSLPATEFSLEQVMAVPQRTNTIEQPHSNGGDFDSDLGDSLAIDEFPRQHHPSWEPAFSLGTKRRHTTSKRTGGLKSSSPHSSKCLRVATNCLPGFVASHRPNTQDASVLDNGSGMVGEVVVEQAAGGDADSGKTWQSQQQHDSVFGGTGEWFARYGGVKRHSVDGKGCVLQRTTAGALGVSSDATPGRSKLPAAAFASRIHQPLPLQPHQQSKQPQQEQPGLWARPSKQVTQINPREVIPPVPQRRCLEPPQSIHWQPQQSWQQRQICAAGAVPPQKSEVLPAHFVTDDAASPPLRQQQPQRPPQFSASLVAKTMENHAASMADALVVDQVGAAAATQKRAKSFLEAAAVEDPFRKSVDADGDLFLSLGLHSKEEAVDESEDVQYGHYNNWPWSPNATSNLGALPSAPPSMMSDTDSPTKPKLLGSNSKYAFATVIFGDDGRFFLEAAVMGASLKARTKMDMVCLHTDEVPEVWRQGLASIGWLLQEVQHIEYSPKVYKKTGRFHQVFTKLQVVGLSNYSKVVMLDSDLLIRSADIDEIFTRDAPAAVRRHSSGDYVDFEPVGDEMFFVQGKQIGGINAGFVLLNASLKDLKKMQLQLKNALVPGRLPFTHGPEQDYLTRYYAGEEWKTLGIQWNFQLHQIAYCTRPKHSKCVRLTMGLDEIKVVHFSGERSLAEWCLGGYSSQTSFEDFVNDFIVEKMLILMRKDILIGKGSEQRQSVVAERLKDVSCRAAAEWKQQLDSLLTSNSSLRDAIKKSVNQKQGAQLAGRQSKLGRSANCCETSAPRVPKTRFGSKRPRLSQGEFPFGSWLCGECGNMNYRGRDVCNLSRCQARRQSHQQPTAAGRVWKRTAQAHKQRSLLPQPQRRPIRVLDNDSTFSGNLGPAPLQQQKQHPLLELMALQDLTGRLLTPPLAKLEEGYSE